MKFSTFTAVLLLLTFAALIGCSAAQNDTSTSTTAASTTTTTTNTTKAATTTKKPGTTAKPVKKPPLWHKVMAFILVGGMLALLALEIGSPEMVMFGTNVAFVALRITKVADAIAGFSNGGMLTVAILSPIAFSLEITGAIDPLRAFFYWVSTTKDGKPRSLAHLICYIMLPSAIISGFINNTPQVAMSIPIMQKLGQQLGISPSKLLMPLSFAVTIGGTICLIGTSTNLVVSGLAEKKDPTLDLGIFSLAPVGIPALLAGIIYLMFIADFIPNRVGVETSINNPRSYITCIVIQENGPLVGKTLNAASMKTLKGLYLIRIERADGTSVNAPGPETALCGGDRLLFTGPIESMLALTGVPGLRVEAENEKDGVDLFHLKGDDILVEAVVSPRSSLVNKSVRDSNFRSEFEAAIIAVHRNGTRLSGKIGDVVLKSGDTLLIVAKQQFMEPHRFHHQFALISKVAGHSYVRRSRAYLSLFFITTLIVCGGATDVDFLELCFYCFAALLLTKCIKVPEAIASIDVPIIINIAAGFGISTGLVKSGAAALVADALIKAGEPTGLIGIYSMLYIATVLFNAVVTNNAAASIMFPIAYEIGTSLGGDIKPILFILMMGASADFMTPTGYQCNLMVYGPGGYAFTDYFKYGAPLQVIMGFVTVGVVLDQDKWWVWTLALIGLMLVHLYLTRKPMDPKKYVSHSTSSTALTANGEDEEKDVCMWHPDLGMEPSDNHGGLRIEYDPRDERTKEQEIESNSSFV